MLEPLNVSRETFEDFEEYSSLILSRNKKINLIGRETEKIVRHRHIIDSAQILDFIDNLSSLLPQSFVPYYYHHYRVHRLLFSFHDQLCQQ